MIYYLQPGMLRRVAQLWAIVASIIFAGLAIQQGPPVPPEGPGIETDIQYIFVLVGIFSTLIALRWPRQGGALLVFTGMALGIAAAGRYSAETSFLVALMFVVPGVLLLAAWSLTRGIFAQGFSVAFVVILLAYGGVTATARHETAFGPAHPQSAIEVAPVDLVEWVWSGGVSSDEATIKARLVDHEATARLAFSTSSDLSSARFVEGAALGDGVSSFSLSSLDPYTTYYYAVEVGGRLDEGRRGSVRTFPEGAASFRFLVAACARTGSNGAVFDAMRNENALFYVISGDFHYENIVGDNPSGFARAYNKNLGADAPGALYRQTPIAYTWDDHDFGGNNSDAGSPAKEAARLAYNRYVPHYDLVAGTGDNPIYQAFSAGRVRVILTDTRSMKNEEKGSMLGSVQRAWLENEIKTASATHALVVWVTGVPWIAADGSSPDDWGGFADERREIADVVAQNGIDNLLVLSGDAHMLAIDDGTNSDYSTSKAGGFPNFQAGALDRPGSVKGGPFSEGTYPGAGQYGVVDVQDNGRSITVKLTGKNWENTEIVSYTFTVPARDRGNGAEAR
ncbi:MAG: alkaline phosphatase D family protein [Dehalococcoidia bacterium]